MLSIAGVETSKVNIMVLFLFYGIYSVVGKDI